MSKLLKLKQWLTVPDAAKYLTEACEEDVTEADVLRFALDGQLTLSVFFVNEHPKAKRASYIPFKDSRLCGVLGLEGEPLPYTDADLLLTTDDEQVELSGVWNLPLIAGDRLDIEHRYQLKTGGQFITKISIDGTFVAGRTSDELFQLQAYFNDGDNNYSYYPAHGLPEDSILVVRTAVIQAFLARALEPEKPMEKPLGNRERETLLTIIGVLAKAAKIDITEPYKAGGVIESIAELEGINLTARTTGDHLKLIPDILENRTKP